jgi:hypothetical protein
MTIAPKKIISIDEWQFVFKQHTSFHTLYSLDRSGFNGLEANVYEYWFARL